MSFSQRKGLRPVNQIIQKDSISQELRNSLWSILDIILWSDKGFMTYTYYSTNFLTYIRVLWLHYFKEPTDTIPPDALGAIRKYFFSCKWHEVYDFLEFTLDFLQLPHLAESVNNILERELAGYRYINGVFSDITSTQEIEALEAALNDSDYPGVKAHLGRALELLSNRDTPDYRNSIKESISAVESLSREITGNAKATLGDALKELERKKKLHPALREAFSKLYGYTSDEAGIRHAMLEEPNLGVAEAKFFLLTCASFINYVKSVIKAA